MFYTAFTIQELRHWGWFTKEVHPNYLAKGSSGCKKKINLHTHLGGCSISLIGASVPFASKTEKQAIKDSWSHRAVIVNHRLCTLTLQCSLEHRAVEKVGADGSGSQQHTKRLSQLPLGHLSESRHWSWYPFRTWTGWVTSLDSELLLCESLGLSNYKETGSFTCNNSHHF